MWDIAIAGRLSDKAHQPFRGNSGTVTDTCVPSLLGIRGILERGENNGPSFDPHHVSCVVGFRIEVVGVRNDYIVWPTVPYAIRRAKQGLNGKYPSPAFVKYLYKEWSSPEWPRCSVFESAGRLQLKYPDMKHHRAGPSFETPGIWLRCRGHCLFIFLQNDRLCWWKVRSHRCQLNPPSPAWSQTWNLMLICQLFLYDKFIQFFILLIFPVRSGCDLQYMILDPDLRVLRYS